MGRVRKQRRQPHGSAWHWKQTDCWYYSLPGAKKRIPLFDEQGLRIRGRDQKEAAELALARVKVAGDGDVAATGNGECLVAKVCSDYLQYCDRGVANGKISREHRNVSAHFLNDFCKYCGALRVAELKKGHVMTWIENHAAWRSSATHRGAIGIVLAAFNRAEEMYGIASPLKGLRKPQAQPRLQSINREDEKTLFDSIEPCFRNFLFAAIHTGLRPFCELARLTADDVEESPRGVMWRVYSSKTKKTRKIPVRAEVAQLTHDLMKTAPRGSGIPLFRNTKGNPWKRMTGVVRFLAIKKKLGWDKDPVKARYSCYTCRHTFAHRMLSGFWSGSGCTIETLAELIGDTPKVAFDHYGKEWGQHYQEPLWAAIGAGSKGTGTSDSSSASSRRAARGRSNGSAAKPRKSKPRSAPARGKR